MQPLSEVPIHGRLFAQWMHEAYPRERCPENEAGDDRNPLWPAACAQWPSHLCDSKVQLPKLGSEGPEPSLGFEQLQDFEFHVLGF